ncbi:hypothetical protein LEN26_012743 [Aphanomyces euteiches]|nr:hypothetical protein LEN26_012743 [Aphanomyces euteiches]KAH9123994.1 hypothetical protein AeMF1_005205 [Aphanomyces euteiches]KAH9181991.1 hypothetical protein AeNC1_016033 [Aphanomyces euteiches]
MDIFARLAEETSQERDNLRRASLVFSASVQESEEADDNSHHGHYDTPTIENIAAQGPQAMMTMTNFSMSEFNSLWGLCEADVNASWYEGRGRRNQTSAKDTFFMLLTVLKHYNTWDKYAAIPQSPEKTIPDNGEGSTDFPDSWVVLQDKGYQGADEAARSIEESAGNMLSRQEFEGNQRVSFVRVLVYNMFGRTYQLWKIAYATFTWSEAKYEAVQRLVWALTNCHTSLHSR